MIGSGAEGRILHGDESGLTVVITDQVQEKSQNTEYSAILKYWCRYRECQMSECQIRYGNRLNNLELPTHSSCRGSCMSINLVYGISRV